MSIFIIYIENKWINLIIKCKVENIIVNSLEVKYIYNFFKYFWLIYIYIYW